MKFRFLFLDILLYKFCIFRNLFSDSLNVARCSDPDLHGEDREAKEEGVKEEGDDAFANDNIELHTSLNLLEVSQS